jgi:DNA-binding GntR family transcriptional regulator
MSKVERVYAVIRERILNGEYDPGHRLVIDGLADELAVSALPIREAIRRLEAEGLVIYRVNAGATVATADPAQFEQGMGVLAVLEGYATALTAPLLAEGDLAGLEAATDRMQECMERLDVLCFGKANREFHAIVYARCPNAGLVKSLEEAARRLDHVRRTVFTHIPYRGVQSIAEHRELIRMLRAGEAFDAIETFARQHKLNTVEAFRRWHEAAEAAAPGRRASGRNRA